MREIETLYPIKKNNKKRNIIIALVIIMLIVGIFIFLKNKNIETNKTKEPNENEEKLVSPPKEDEQIETSDTPPNYTHYTCEKDGNYGILDNNIGYKIKHRYEFFFDWDENTVNIGNYNVDYIFNSINDYNNASSLPITFKDKFYEEKFEENNLTKTLMFYYILEYPNVSLNDLNSYLRALSNDKFICKIVQNKE